MGADNKFIDITGKTFGDWKVLSYVSDGYFLCECVCHRVKKVLGRSLRTGESTTCGHKHPDMSMIGKVYGEWTILGFADNSKWHCKCSCGTEKDILEYHLINGLTHSCGHATTGFKDLTGKVFGSWEVLKRIKGNKWLCRCDCETTKEVTSYSLRSGASTNCGCKNILNLKDKQYGYLKVLRRNKTGNTWVCKCICGEEITRPTQRIVNGGVKSCGCMTTHMKRQTLMERYGEFATSRVKNPRSLEVIQACSNTKVMAGVIEELKRAYGRKIWVKDLAKALQIGETATLRIIRQLGLEDKVQLNVFGQMEEELAEYIQYLNPSLNIIRKDRKILNGKELDIYIPDLKLAIEFNGTYWHSDIFKDKNYHQQKSLNCARLGIQLIHIFEYEWGDDITRGIIKSILRDKISTQNKIYTPDHTIKQVEYEEYVPFLEKYSLYGNEEDGIIAYGLYDQLELIGVATLGKPISDKIYDYELMRLAWKHEEVIGGLEAIIKQFIKDYTPESIITYCDLTKYTGNEIIKAGFNLSTNMLTEPNYAWINKDTNDILKRYTLIDRNVLSGLVVDTGEGEAEILEELGYIRIYDAGSFRYEWRG